MWSLFIDLKHFPQPLSQGAVPGHSSHFEGTFESRCACDLVRVQYFYKSTDIANVRPGTFVCPAV